MSKPSFCRRKRSGLRAISRRDIEFHPFFNFDGLPLNQSSRRLVVRAALVLDRELHFGPLRRVREGERNDLAEGDLRAFHLTRPPVDDDGDKFRLTPPGEQTHRDVRLAEGDLAVVRNDDPRLVTENQFEIRRDFRISSQFHSRNRVRCPTRSRARRA